MFCVLCRAHRRGGRGGRGLLLIFTRSANRDLERFHQQKVLASDMQELLSVFDGMDTLASQVASNTELLNFFIPCRTTKRRRITSAPT